MTKEHAMLLSVFLLFKLLSKNLIIGFVTVYCFLNGQVKLENLVNVCRVIVCTIDMLAIASPKILSAD
jgi:hypothetical protein